MIMVSHRILAITVAIVGAIIASQIISSGITYGKDYQKKSLAVSQANYCGQGKIGMSVQCSNTVSQTQGNENGIALSD